MNACKLGLLCLAFWASRRNRDRRDCVRSLVRRRAGGNDWICCGHLLEPGPPCSHEQLPLHWKAGVNVKPVHAAHVKEFAALPAGQRPRTVTCTHFTTLFDRHHPPVKPHRLQEDVCDACARIDALVESEGTSSETEAALIEQKKMHVDGARARRRFVAEHAKKVIAAANPDQAGVAKLLQSCRWPQQDLDDVEAGQLGPLRHVTTMVLAEDFGGNLETPVHFDERPGSDLSRVQPRHAHARLRDVRRGRR